jgi:hypothetical protein
LAATIDEILSSRCVNGLKSTLLNTLELSGTLLEKGGFSLASSHDHFQSKGISRRKALEKKVHLASASKQSRQTHFSKIGIGGDELLQKKV